MTTRLSAILCRSLIVKIAAAALSLAFAACASSSPYGTPLPQSVPVPHPNSCASTQAAPPELAKNPNYHQVIVSAQNHSGQPLPKLNAKDLRLYQGDKEVKIAFFQQQSASVAILIDTSGSMESKLPICRTALEAFINQLYPSDKISLFGFSDQAFQLAGPTTEHAVVIRSLERLHAFGRTALYDSLGRATEVLSEACAKTKAILLITDGMDTSSTATLKETLDTARNANIPIYSIGIGDSKFVYASQFPFVAGGMADKGMDPTTINILAQDSGGEALLVTLNNEGDELKRAVRAIANRIGNEFVIGFISGSTAPMRVEAPQYSGVTLKLIGADSTAPASK